MANLSEKYEESLHRLDGSSGTERGGLVIMKQKSADGSQHTFKSPETPRSSLLGLDRLAAEKRKEQELEKSASKFKKPEEKNAER
jgi:pre-mRNA-splicing factor ATP-dependent RNA helicase DHX38/PRP16